MRLSDEFTALLRKANDVQQYRVTNPRRDAADGGEG
jgi:hypothetical protein